MKKSVYLANPYGFSQQQKHGLLPAFVEAIGSLGAEVWEPFQRNNQIDFTASYTRSGRDSMASWNGSVIENSSTYSKRGS